MAVFTWTEQLMEMTARIPESMAFVAKGEIPRDLQVTDQVDLRGKRILRWCSVKLRKERIEVSGARKFWFETL
jgi:hypothetical protein